jgi:hypothetical protein
VDKLKLNLLCTLLSHVEREAGNCPTSESFGDQGTIRYGTVLHHVAFAIGEGLIELAAIDRHALQLTPRGERAHALLCAPERKPEVDEFAGERTGEQLSIWLEERIGLHRRTAT